VEVAAYRIVQEALAERRAPRTAAHDCRVELSLDSALHVAVTDDGIGLPMDRRAGVGLTSMARAGGRARRDCLVEGAPTATRVLAELPLATLRCMGGAGRAGRNGRRRGEISRDTPGLVRR